MAREGVSYEQVRAAAESLIAEGREPSIRAVRERLRGTGSPNTIHRHLTKWREARPEVPVASTDLPQSIIREINGEIQRAAAAARAEVEAQLAQAQTEAADLAAAGEVMEAERDSLLEQLAALTSERDVLAGKAAEQAAEIERLGQEVERERRAAEEARIEVAKTRLQLDARAGQFEEQRQAIERHTQDLQQERQARTAAERDLAATVAAREGLAERLAELQVREQTALREVGELRNRADRSAMEAHAAAGDIARLQEALTRESAEAERLRAETARLREQLVGCTVENVASPTPPGGSSRAKKGG